MRNIGLAHRAFDMLCERALSRSTFGTTLAQKQTVQNWIADSVAEIQSARLLTVHAANNTRRGVRVFRFPPQRPSPREHFLRALSTWLRRVRVVGVRGRCEGESLPARFLLAS